MRGLLTILALNILCVSALAQSAFDAIRVDRISPRYWKEVTFTRPIRMESGMTLLLTSSPAVRENSDSVVSAGQIYSAINTMATPSLFSKSGTHLIPATVGDDIGLGPNERLRLGFTDTEYGELWWNTALNVLNVDADKISFNTTKTDNNIIIESLPDLNTSDLPSVKVMVRYDIGGNVYEITPNDLISQGGGVSHAPGWTPYSSFEVNDLIVYDAFELDNLISPPSGIDGILVRGTDDLVYLDTEQDPVYESEKASYLEWSDTSQVNGVGIATYDDLRNVTVTEVDGSVTNEGSLSVGAGGSNSSIIQSNTSGSTAVTLSGDGNITVNESGSTITVGGGGYVLQFSGSSTASVGLNDAYTYYYGLGSTSITNGIAGRQRVYVIKSGTIKAAHVNIFFNPASVGSNESWSFYIRLNNTTDYLIETVSSTSNPRIWTNNSLNISINAGDYLELKTVCPTWATNPFTTSNSPMTGILYIE